MYKVNGKICVKLLLFVLIYTMHACLLACLTLIIIYINYVVNFQVMIAANDGLFDGPGFNSDESQLMATCLHLLFRVLLALFAWYLHSLFLLLLSCRVADAVLSAS